jgi:predicted MFS family arabinose efflux permease
MKYRLLLLSLGAFAISTEGFMIAGVLPTIGREFEVSLSVAG